LREFDFAVLIWAPDDMTESKENPKLLHGTTSYLECGLFPGAVGRERDFIICDQSISLKIPPVLELRWRELRRFANRRRRCGSCRADGLCFITREIQRPRFPTIVGEWKSRYALSAELGHAGVIDEVEIKAARGGLSIISKNNAAALITLAMAELFMSGRPWVNGPPYWAIATNGERFMLAVNPRGTVTYGIAQRSRNMARPFTLPGSWPRTMVLTPTRYGRDCGLESSS
jgi:hypothetical protein